jgi:hypothetical protein
MRVSAINLNPMQNFTARKDNDNKIKSVSSITVPMVIAAMTLAASANSCSKEDVFEYDKTKSPKDSLETQDSTDYKPPFEVIIDTTYNEIYEDIILFSKNNR